MTKIPRDRQLPKLPMDVREYVVEKLGDNGNKANACLHTAATLLTQAIDDDDANGLRLPESAAYNIREAFDAVVATRPPGRQVLNKVVPAWKRYQLTQEQPDSERDHAWTELEEALTRAASEEGRLSRRDNQLLDYLRSQSGVAPLPREHNPVSEYARLYKVASEGLHSSYAAADAVMLYKDTLSWFLRMFTPPDTKVHAISALAAQEYRDGNQITELQELITDIHHVRLFLNRIADPAWVDPLYRAGFLQLPRRDEPWPLLGLVNGLGSTHPDDVVDVLDHLCADIDDLESTERPAVAFEVLRTSLHLGEAAHPIIQKTLRQYPTDRWIQAIATSVVKDADPTNRIVYVIADSVLGNESRHDGTRQAQALLERLEAGAQPDNVIERTTTVAAKVQRLAADDRLRIVSLDNAALTVPLGDEREPVIVLAHFLLRLLQRARELGFSTSDLLEWVRHIPGQVGERITCQVLTGADDVSLGEKINHVARRVRSAHVTGDDHALVKDILVHAPTEEDLHAWSEALGEPPPSPEEPVDATTVPKDWVRVWGWSAVLPIDQLARWRHQVAHVSALANDASVEPTLYTRSERMGVRSGQSPISKDDLALLSVEDAAALVSSWRPKPSDRWELRSARELARTLERVVTEDLNAWTGDPAAVVVGLREPVYIQHYFRTLVEHAGALTDRAPAIFAAARLTRDAMWEPTPLGDPTYDFEPDWTGVDITIVDLVAALANKDGALSDDLDEAWAWAVAMVDEGKGGRDLPDPDGARDPLNSAINQPWGRGLKAVLSLARWEYRNRSHVRPMLRMVLSEAIAVGGYTELEFRAILAARRPLLEALVPEWLETKADLLFRNGDLGQPTFDLTITWSRPTPWFLTRYRKELVAAAKRGTENAAAWLVIGALNRETGYEWAKLIRALRGDEAALAAIAKESASLVENCEPDESQLAVAVDLWRGLLDACPQEVPPTALTGLSRWAFVAHVDADTWGELMVRTLRLTDSPTPYAIEVAERCAAAPGCRHAGEILRLLLVRGEPWENSRVADIAFDVLRTAGTQLLADDFYKLRSRLIEVGRAAAADILLPDRNQET